MTQRYHYQPIQTPHVEFSGLFERTLGATSDVIKKEMFMLQSNNTHTTHTTHTSDSNLNKKNNRSSSSSKNSTIESNSESSMCLRPEGTAGIVRSVIQHNLFHRNLFYLGSMYRYERPQKGRLRQFTQFGVEKIGENNNNNNNKSSISSKNKQSLHQDVEVLQMAHSFLKSIGVLENGRVQLELNSLGNSRERFEYCRDMVQFLEPLTGELCEESRYRLHRALRFTELQQVWRILDSKSESDQRLLVNHGAPKLSEYYSDETRERFESLKDVLSDLGIEYVVNPYLVRGLDYYSHTTFEFVSNIPSTNTTATTTTMNEPTRNVAVLAGGRYDGLFPMLGSKNEVEAIGWAAGVERLSLLLDQVSDSELAVKKPVSICVIGLTGSSADREIERECMRLAQRIRESNEMNVDFSVVGPIYGSKLLNGLQRAEREGCSLAILLGSREVENRVCTIKGLTNRDVKVECSFDRITEELSSVLNNMEK